MPTHFSRLEGSPANRHLERRRKRRQVAATSPFNYGFEESSSSNVTAQQFNIGPMHSDASTDIPDFIQIHNWRRLQQTNRAQEINQRDQRQTKEQGDRRPPRQRGRLSQKRVNESNQGKLRPHQYDAYCESRVSAIASFPTHVGPGSSKVSSLSSVASSEGWASINDQERDDRYAVVVSPRGSRPSQPRHSSPRSSQNTNVNRRTQSRFGYTKNAESRIYFAHDLSSEYAPSDPSTLTTSTARGPRAAHTLVDDHGVFGSDHSRNRDYGTRMQPNIAKPVSASNIHWSKNDLDSQLHSDLSRKDLNAFVLSKNSPAFSRRKRIEISADSDSNSDSDTLRGEKFADAYSNSQDPMDMLSLHPPKGSKNVGEDAARPTYNGKTNSNARQVTTATQWLCDVCKEARFDSYVEAYRHEIECQKIQDNKLRSNEDMKALQQQQEAINNKTKIRNINNKNLEQLWGGDLITNQLQEMSLSSSTGSESSHQREGEFGRNENAFVAPTETSKWLCSVCNKKSFNNYREACLHENICRIQMEATSDLRGVENAHRRTSGLRPQSVSVDLKQNRDDGTDGRVETTANLQWNSEKQIGMLPVQSPYHTWKGDENHLQNRSEATLAALVDKQLGTKDHPLPLFHIQTGEPSSRHNHVATNHPENSLEINNEKDIERQNVRNSIDLIERKRDFPSDSCFDETRDDQHHSFHTNAKSPQDFIFASAKPRNSKGEAYDRYVSLASQQDEEEERERYIALAKQTREEELMSYRRGHDEEERYVCLA